jgi:hypothetical protein
MVRRFVPFVVVPILREIIPVRLAYFFLNDHHTLGVAVRVLALALRITIFQSVDTIVQELRTAVRSPHLHTGL